MEKTVHDLVEKLKSKRSFKRSFWEKEGTMRAGRRGMITTVGGSLKLSDLRHWVRESVATA